MGALTALRQSEYVGENRCLPCTMVNVAIAAVVGIAVGTWALAAGVVVFATCLEVIYLRGYLVPGTPRLTKRYLPDRVLRWFDKAPSHASAPADTTDAAFDPEALLSAAGAIEPCDEDDLCLQPGFRDVWHDRIETVREHKTGSAALKRAVNEGDDRVAFERVGGDIVAIGDNAMIGRWVSAAAVGADVAAADLLSARLPRWDRLTPGERIAVFATLRLFLETCPACGGPVELTQEESDSCCRSADVVRTACLDCETRLCEFEWD